MPRHFKIFSNTMHDQNDNTFVSLKDDNSNFSQTANWIQSTSQYTSTPSAKGDSTESLTDLVSVPTSVVGRSINVNQIHYQSRGDSSLDITPPPQAGDTISNLLCLNIPRGSLDGNYNPLTTNLTNNTEMGGRYSESDVRYNTSRTDSSISRKYNSSYDYNISPIQPVSPIAPPNGQNNRSADDNLMSSFGISSLPQLPSESMNKTNSETNNMENLKVNQQRNFAYPTQQELVNLQNLCSLRTRSSDNNDLIMKLIERTNQLLYINRMNVSFDNDNKNDWNSYGLGTPLMENRQMNYCSEFNNNLDSDLEQKPTEVWIGTLSPRVFSKNATYSCKVFFGGTPWDITETTLMQALSRFGQIRVEWPGKDRLVKQPKGFSYVIFENENKVKSLLDYCKPDYTRGGKYYYRISSKKMKAKEAQVIPWIISESNYSQIPQKLDPRKTVFVGGIHGMVNAEDLAKIMESLFGQVMYAGLDTDKYKYPIGSGRVSFCNEISYIRAIKAAFIEIRTPQFTKKVQINPYMEDSACNICEYQRGPYFCRELSCLKYFCYGCWDILHASDRMKSHKKKMRQSKNTSSSIANFTPPSQTTDTYNSSPPNLYSYYRNQEY